MKQKKKRVSNHISEDILLFQDRNRQLPLKPFLDVEEVGLKDFFSLIFTRRGTDGYPFEARQCAEYCSWALGEDYRDDQPFVYNALLLGITNGRGLHHVVLQDMKGIEEFIALHPFCILSPITYVGRTRKAENARYLFALVFDLDGVGLDQLRDLNHQVRHKVIPPPSMIVNSGHGLHLYYLLEKPIPLFKDATEILQRLKHALTDVIWNMYTSSCLTKQFQGIYQGFRVPTSNTKFGTSVTVFARKGEPRYWTCGELNKYIRDDEDRLSPTEVARLDKGKFDPQRLTRKRAKEMYPEWYERVVERGEKGGRRWAVNRGLYDWWVKKLRKKDTKVTPGHRYFCLLAIASFGIKCGIDPEEVKKDIFSFVDEFESLTDKEDNHFTARDAEDAYKAYKEDYCTLPRRTIERLTGIRIDPTRRNGRSRKVHLTLARAQQDALCEIEKRDWREGNGRPKGSTISAEDSPKAKMIQEWRADNPQGNKSACARDLGISRPTVIKWWDALPLS